MTSLFNFLYNQGWLSVKWTEQIQRWCVSILVLSEIKFTLTMKLMFLISVVFEWEMSQCYIYGDYLAKPEGITNFNSGIVFSLSLSVARWHGMLDDKFFSPKWQSCPLTKSSGVSIKSTVHATNWMCAVSFGADHPSSAFWSLRRAYNCNL